MKSALLLQQLDQQFHQLAQAVQPHLATPTGEARFDVQLFHCRATRLGDYLAEIRQSLAQLRHSVDGGRPERVAWMAERLVLQMGALQRELATQNLRKQPPRQRESPLYEKLATHQDYERRLRAMVTDRESLLVTCDTLMQQQRLQREIAAFEGRLQRCQQAIKHIERAIEKQEN